MKFQILKRRQWWAVSVLFLIQCSPDLPDYVGDYDLVYTKQDKNFNFSAINTYSMPDSVVHVTAQQGGTADHTYDEQILQRLETNLNALGWTRISTPTAMNKADVVVLPAVNRTANAVCDLYCWYCYWGWWPYWNDYPYPWNSDWGWFYPTDIACGSYNTGSLVVTITNPSQALPTSKEMPIIWVGVANGLVEGSPADVSQRINKNIDQMFIQSPYLK